MGAKRLESAPLTWQGKRRAKPFMLEPSMDQRMVRQTVPDSPVLKVDRVQGSEGWERMRSFQHPFFGLHSAVLRP